LEAGVLVGTGAIPITGIIHILFGARNVIVADIMDYGDITRIGIMDSEIIMAGDPGFFQIMAMEGVIREALHPPPFPIKPEIITELLQEEIHGVQ
jgi:hypothetical protein